MSPNAALDLAACLHLIATDSDDYPSSILSICISCFNENLQSKGGNILLM